jgi:hypothetical protein
MDTVTGGNQAHLLEKGLCLHKKKYLYNVDFLW